MINWGNIEGFSKREFAPPEEPDHKWDMHPALLTHLVNMRESGLDRFDGEFRMLIHANGGYSIDGHSKSSLHYGIESDTLNGIRLGRAVDFHCEHYSDNHKCWVIVNWIDQIMLLKEANPILIPCFRVFEKKYPFPRLYLKSTFPTLNKLIFYIAHFFLRSL